MGKAIFCILLAVCFPAASAQAGEVAVTVDDLPYVFTAGLAEDAHCAQSERLLKVIAAEGVPAVGFVNEGRLYRQGQPDAACVDLLRHWLAAGLELGNHGYSHLSLETSSLAAARDDVVRGETVTKPLAAEYGRPYRYFRYPYLHRGSDAAKRQGFLDFLTARGYTVAPVTVSVEDWVFAVAYAKVRGADPDLAAKVVAAYLAYIDESFRRAEKLAADMLGRPVRQILLLHADAINADHFAEVAAVLRRRGYRIVALERALDDPLYRMPDLCSSPEGLTWLERQALSVGLTLDRPPALPVFVRQLAGPSARGY